MAPDIHAMIDEAEAELQIVERFEAAGDLEDGARADLAELRSHLEQVIAALTTACEMVEPDIPTIH